MTQGPPWTLAGDPQDRPRGVPEGGPRGSILWSGGSILAENAKNPKFCDFCLYIPVCLRFWGVFGPIFRPIFGRFLGWILDPQFQGGGPDLTHMLKRSLPTKGCLKNPGQDSPGTLKKVVQKRVRKSTKKWSIFCIFKSENFPDSFFQDLQIPIFG